MNECNNQFSPYNMDEVIKKHKIDKEKRELRKRSISTGLLCTVTVALFTIIALILYSAITGTLENTPLMTDNRFSLIPDMLLNGLVSLIGFGLVGLIFCSITKTDFCEIFPHKNVSTKKMLGVISIGFTVCICANYIAQLFLIDLSIFGVEPTYNLDDTGSTSLLEHIVYIIAVSMVPAVTEEFIFRGCVMGRLRKFGEGFALLVSAVMFGLMHGNFTQAVFAFIVGLAAGWSVIYTGSIIPAMAIHFFNNLMSVLADITFENMESAGLDTKFIDLIVLSIYLLIFSVAVYSTYRLAKSDKDFIKFKPYEGELDFKSRIKIFFTSFSVIIFVVITILECLVTLKVIE